MSIVFVSSFALMKLIIGFLTYNEASAKYLPDFLASLFKSLQFLAPIDYQVLAFDNSDNNNNLNRLAIEFINSEHPNFIDYLSSGENLGFSRAYNILINRALREGSEYFLMINPDTVLETNAIQELSNALDKNKNLAAVAPKIFRWDFLTNTKTKQIDSCGLILKTGLRFKDLGQGLDDSTSFDQVNIIGPSGAAGLFRLTSLEMVKENNQYLDERFFMYREDCDLAYRLHLKNLKTELVPGALIYHDRTATSSGLGLWRMYLDRGKKSRQIRLWSHLNQHYIYLKHWRKQNFVNKFFILVRVAAIFIFSLILEQFVLKNYSLIRKFNNT